MRHYMKLKIPSNAKLEDVIFLINEMEYEVDVNDEKISKFLYGHRDWIVEN